MISSLFISIVCLFVFLDYKNHSNNVQSRMLLSMTNCSSLSHDQNRAKLIRNILLKEARAYYDPCFEFLWYRQKKMESFTDTAGGRTTYLRLYNATTNFQ